MRLHPAALLLLAACPARDAADRPSGTAAVPPAESTALAPAAAAPAMPDADDPRAFLDLDSLRWSEWETQPPTDRDARLRELGIEPIRSDSAVEFDPSDGYDPNGERARDFHFVDFSGDGVADVIYDGPWFARNDAGEFGAAEGVKLKLWQTIGGRGVLVMDHHGSVQRVWPRPGAPSSFRTLHHGCCSDPQWVIEYFRPVTAGDTVRYERVHQVMGREELQIPTTFLPAPRRFTVNNDRYLLRASPRVDDQADDVWPRWEGRGNALAEYGHGATGTAVAEQADSTGRVWWFVRMDGRTPPTAAQTDAGVDSAGRALPTDRLGWMSSRFLTPRP
jgi:hypothetical protein